MYHHLLVPVDGTDLSVEVVGNAVGLARTLGARVTFFHALADHAGSLRGEADVVRLTSQADHAYAYLGKARELLAKAEAAARAFGVPCDSTHTVSDRPAAAIVAAARDRGCDLIFMASHGHRGRLGMALGSQTLQVLMNSGLPVLVSSTGEPKPTARAIATIRDEHRSLAAVLHAWMHALAAARESGVAADPQLMQAIVRYIEQFPVALHHPKEESYLFSRLRERSEAASAELDELERQHARDRALVAELARQVGELRDAAHEADRIRLTRALEESVQHYAVFLWEHMGREEGVILPAAQRHLTASDWQEIDAAFAENRDPRFDEDTDRRYRQLFSRIVNLAGA